MSKGNQQPGKDYIFELQRRPFKLRIYPDSILRDKATPECFDSLPVEGWIKVESYQNGPGTC
ncbi:MAG: hypothetical protein AMJ79_09250 [Phycisphaerae bacterium SM23_30]|nr:MAG: hypothetical protein AMJ79_09250 [Phycisphaerae bacterium SM23_30]